MKPILRFVLTTFTLAGLWFSAVAQDDYYYDPDKDKGFNSVNHPAYQYDAPDETTSYTQNGNTYITNNYYYDDDWDDFYYTSRLRRFYTPNWGVGFYSYWFTPSFYFGWSNWNTNFWGWNAGWWPRPWNRWWAWRPGVTVVFYDPWWDSPFWGWGWGWNSCSFFGPWYSPWCAWNSFYTSPCFWNTWGCNAWAWNNGWCGWGNNYWNGYWNGYNQGYWDGYYNGWWNSPFAGGGWWGGFYRQGPDGNSTQTPAANGVSINRNNGMLNVSLQNSNSNSVADIPPEGITRPFKPSLQNTNKSEVRVNDNPQLDDKPFKTPYSFSESRNNMQEATKPSNPAYQYSGPSNKPVDAQRQNAQEHVRNPQTVLPPATSAPDYEQRAPSASSPATRMPQTPVAPQQPSVPRPHTPAPPADEYRESRVRPAPPVREYQPAQPYREPREHSRPSPQVSPRQHYEHSQPPVSPQRGGSFNAPREYSRPDNTPRFSPSERSPQFTPQREMNHRAHPINPPAERNFNGPRRVN
ncbi:MAG: hypothetical protein NZM35_01480 [Chitinophagales bacterium]|nr:hypothetical protein [Chitinophagales bacterium]MDW8417951.1 hypothetical protein [Chitinophagales bacterium]